MLTGVNSAHCRLEEIVRCGSHGNMLDFEEITGVPKANPDELDAAAISVDVFAEWRAPRFGTKNPERMNNPLWEWLVRTRIDAREVTNRFHGPSSREAGPAWCFDRMGQSVTHLPDGRVILIAGEHEDHYDRDFCIYNDVVVRSPDGSLDIFGYPRNVFPPTDFHTATRRGNQIILIGSLGYPSERKHGQTQVAVLDLNTWAITMIATVGTPPGWLYDHKAEPSEDGTAILIRRGMIDPVTDDDRSLRENIDDWRLRLDDWQWERLTGRRWERREFLRKDRKELQLWSLKSLASTANCISHLECGDPDTDDSEMRELFTEMRKLSADAAARNRDEDARLRDDGLSTSPQQISQLFHPDIPHAPVPESEDFGDEYAFKVVRIRVDGVIVRYVDEDSHVQMTVEGDLPTETVDALAADLLRKLEDVQNAPCEVRRI